MKKLKLNRCRYCLSKENLTIDHRHPKILGGTDDIKNLQCLCRRCNQMKSGIPDGVISNLWKWFKIVDDERIQRGKLPRFSK